MRGDLNKKRGSYKLDEEFDFLFSKVDAPYF